MFSSTSLLAGNNSRRTATLLSAAVHAAAVAALWAAGQAITAPPAPHHELRGAVRLVSPPPRMFLPRKRPRTKPARFVMERRVLARTPEAIHARPQAPPVRAREAPPAVLPQEPAVTVTRPAARPAGFAEVARAATARLELEPQAAAFGSALGRREEPSVIPRGGTTSFGAAGLTQIGTLTGPIGSGGFGDMQTVRAPQRADEAREAGFVAAERRPAPKIESEPASADDRNQPVKILWKPVPKYSEEGIRRRIEGDVVLMVRFLSQGTVETLEVVSGLGYGLDEYARQAAEAIRFEPATRDGRPVDYTARVRIRFELAY